MDIMHSFEKWGIDLDTPFVTQSLVVNGFHLEQKAKESIDCYKARLVAKAFIDYLDLIIVILLILL